MGVGGEKAGSHQSRWSFAASERASSGYDAQASELHFEASAVAPLRLGCYSKTLTPVVVATEPSHFAFSFANAGPTQCELIHPPNWRVHEAASGGRPKASGSIRRARISRATGGSPPISPSGGLGSARGRRVPADSAPA